MNSNDEQEREPIALMTADDFSMSESDLDDDLSSITDDRLENLNLGNVRHIVSMGFRDRHDPLDLGDSESEDDMSKNLIPSLDLDKINKKLEKGKYKFSNFGAEEEQEKEEAPKKKSRKQPQEKKRRRDKGKSKVDVMEALEDTRTDDLDRVLNRFRQEASDSDDDVSVPKKMKKKSGRKTRKKASKEEAMDENGERMMRTTTLLDETSSSSEDEKPLSRKEEEELYRESERLRRNKKISLKPTYHLKSFDDFVKRRDEKEQDYLNQLASQKQKSSSIPVSKQNPSVEDSDSDIEIIGDPRKIAAKLASPDRPRYPISNFSPVKNRSSYKDFNRRMLEKITNQGYEYRMKMEAAAKARGQFASATERAKRLLEREKDAMMINEQINQHFEKQKQNQTDDDMSDLDDDDEEEEDDIFNELSGSEDDFQVEEADESAKRKLSDKEEDEDDMATGAFKRWKNKKIKKSIFDEDDDDEITKKKKTAVASKPEPKHSIANFFKAKEQEKIESTTDEAKPLSRLVQKQVVEQQPNNDIDQNNDGSSVENNVDDEMDVDEHIPEPITQKATPSKPSVRNVEFFEEEAEEEEDEFFGAGGSDGENGENLDEFEKDNLLVEDNNEHVDEALLRDAFNKQDEESDKNLIHRLITDITSGGLRKQKAAAEAGLMLEDIDLYDEEDNDLVAIRRMQAARRRKLLKMRGGDTLENLLKDPKTAAFAKAFQAIPDEPALAFLSDEEGVDMEEKVVEEKKITSKRVIIEEEDEEDEEEKKDIMDNFSSDEELVVSELDEMATPLRGGYLGVEEEVESFEIETMRSPVAARKAKSLFASPSSTERFKRIIAEASNAVNGTADSGGPRIGFGSVKNMK